MSSATHVLAKKDNYILQPIFCIMGCTRKGTIIRKQPARVTRLKTIRAPLCTQLKLRNSTTARATPLNSGGLPTSDPPRRTRSNTSTSATTSSASSSSVALTQDDISCIVHVVLNSLLPNHQTASGTQFIEEEDMEEVTEALKD